MGPLFLTASSVRRRPLFLEIDQRELQLERRSLLAALSLRPTMSFVTKSLIYANKNSFVLSSLIVSRSFAAFSNSNCLAASRMSDSSFAI
jgi:hypothetical protein